MRRDPVGPRMEDECSIRSGSIASDGERVYAAIVCTDREKAPGDAGFIQRDTLGWVAGRMSEIVTSVADASTLSADQISGEISCELRATLKP